MRRREFITLLGNAALYSVAARARQSAMPVIGFLAVLSSKSPAASSVLESLRRGLAEYGYVEGKDVSFEFRSGEGVQDRMPTLATELVMAQVDVIVAGGTRAALAAKAATKTIPIVFAVGSDPVAAGLVASLNRPGGNLTGYSDLISELVVKRLELLHEMVPAARVIAFLVNPSNPDLTRQETQAARDAARVLGLQLHVVEVSDEAGFDRAFVMLAELQAGALLVSGDGLLTSRRDQIVALADRYRVPAIYVNREFAAVGGLMSYGSSFGDQFRRIGVYTARILKGEKPADLPVMQPTKFELVFNLEAAQALGLAVPPSILTRADEVIE